MADQKANEMEPVETQVVEIMPPDIENLIYVIRNKQVMVDSDLAMLYQVETKALNRAVKRNIKRFPEDFCFQLTTEEAIYMLVEQHRYSRMVQCMGKMPMSRPDMYLRSR